jgi:hypothetical protein
MIRSRSSLHDWEAEKKLQATCSIHQQRTPSLSHQQQQPTFALKKINTNHAQSLHQDSVSSFQNNPNFSFICS